MTTESIDHNMLSRMVEVGVAWSTYVVDQDGGWIVFVRYGQYEVSLMTQRNKKIRLFRNFETQVNYLKKLGIMHFDVNASGYYLQHTTDSKINHILQNGIPAWNSSTTYPMRLISPP